MNTLPERPTKKINAQAGSGKVGSSPSLLDESAVLACTAYVNVNVNPIRTKMQTTPETSKHTSI